MSKDNDKKKAKVQIFKRINRLKVKAGSTVGGPPIVFSKERLEDPKKFFEEHTQNYDVEIESVLNELEEAWNDFRGRDKLKRNIGRETLYHKANHAKDLASTCDYPLMQHFGLSLREFVENIDPDSEKHQTIVRAHIDVMWTTKNEDIRDDGGKKAKELKEMVQIAINKFGG